MCGGMDYEKEYDYHYVMSSNDASLFLWDKD